MHRAAKKMLEIGFEKYQLDKINLRCAIQNERSCNVAKKLGMSHEGRHRSAIKVNELVMDIDLYSLLRTEFKG